MSISNEQFWTIIKGQNSTYDLNDLLIKVYQESLQESMWMINHFIHQQVRRKFDRSPEEYTKGLLSEYELTQKIYVIVKNELQSGLVSPYKINEIRENQESRRKYLTVMEEYMNFIKCIEYGQLTTLDLIDKLIESVNSLPQINLELRNIYRILNFQEVVSFGFDDGRHDVIRTHFGFWSEIFQIGYVLVKNNIENHFDDLDEMNSYLNSLKDGLKSPF